MVLYVVKEYNERSNSTKGNLVHYWTIEGGGEGGRTICEWTHRGEGCEADAILRHISSRSVPLEIFKPERGGGSNGIVHIEHIAATSMWLFQKAISCFIPPLMKRRKVNLVELMSSLRNVRIYARMSATSKVEHVHPYQLWLASSCGMRLTSSRFVFPKRN